MKLRITFVAFLATLLIPFSSFAEDPPKKDQTDIGVLGTRGAPCADETSENTAQSIPDAGFYLIVIIDEQGYVVDFYVDYLDPIIELPTFPGFMIIYQHLPSVDSSTILYQ